MDERLKRWFASSDDWKNFERKIIDAYVEHQLSIGIWLIASNSPANIESPIELLFFIGWRICDFHGLKQWQCIPQVNLSPYRFDFAFIHSIENRCALLIECDGFDFHERTKEQASHDRAKDRFAQRNGFVVFRFTGTDLWMRLGGCLEEVSAFLQKQPETRIDELVELTERAYSEGIDRLEELSNKLTVDECLRVRERLKLKYPAVGAPDALV